MSFSAFHRPIHFWIRRLLTLCIASTLVGWTPAAQSAPVGASAGYAADVLLVGLRPGMRLADALAKGSARAEALFPFAAGLSAQSNPARAALARIYKVRLPAGSDVLAAAAEYRARPEVEFAEPDYAAQPALAPNDARYAEQWGLAKINAAAGWDVTTGALTTTIAIVDSGLYAAHEDLTGRLWVNAGETANNGLDDDGNGLVDDVNGWNFVAGNNDLSDENGHGTEVAGVAGARGNNSVGIAGLCWACRLMVVKVMQASGVVNYSDVAAGVAYAAGQGARVINLSLGGYADSATLRTAIESAAQTAVVVAGAGNDNRSALFYPAAYADVLAVAATDANNLKAAFSNYGAWVDLAAPGANILTTLAGGGYGNQNGTSLSAPFVAGLAGLVISQHPDWSAALVRQQILNTAASIDGSNPAYAGKFGYGLIAAGAALTSAAQPQMTVGGWTLDGQASARPDKGKSYALALTLNNTWLPARGLTATLTTSTVGVSISDNAGTFGDLNTGQSKNNAADPFGIALSNGLAYSQLLSFTLRLRGADGYSLDLPFSLQVRSGTVTWAGNANLTSDTIWTADQSYVITKTLIVKPGVTLTIQPGTVVRASISGTLRIDGTLIARGTADQPVVFGAWPPTATVAGNLNFTSSGAPAAWDGAGQYVSGQAVQFTNLTGWNINLSDRGLWLADSSLAGGALTGGSNAMTLVLAGNSRFERNTFTNGANVILYGGASVIRDNTFRQGGSASALSLYGGGDTVTGNTVTGYGVAVYGAGLHTIVSNTFANNSGPALSLGGWNPVGGANAPSIHDNYIVGNAAGAISGSGWQGVDIEHNLIANNGGAGGMCMPTCSGGASVVLGVDAVGNSQSTPVLVYNPDQGEYLLLWSESNGTQGVIKAQRVLSDGQTAGAAFSLGAGYNPALTYNPDQREYYAAWNNGAYGGVYGRRISASGAPLGAAAVITSSLAYRAQTVYQSVAGGYLTVWQDQAWPNRLFAQRVLSDGALLGAALQIGADVTGLTLGDLAYDPLQNRALVLFKGDRSSDGCFGCLLGAWLTPADMGSVPAFKVSSSSAGNSAAAFGAGRFFSVWEYGTGLAEQVITDSAVFSGSGYITPTILYAGAGSVNLPRAAYASGSGQFLTIWAYASGASNDSIRGQRALTDGALAGGVLLISQSAVSVANPQTPALAYNPARQEYLVVWSDGRAGAYQIYGQRLGAAGQLLDNAWTTADETNPAVNFRLTSAPGLRYNTFLNNTAYGLQLSGSQAGALNVTGNNFVGNAGYDLYLPSGTQNLTVTAANNYWGVDPGLVPGRVRDCEFDDPNGCNQNSSVLGKVVYDPALAAPAPLAPGFVSAVRLAPTNGADGDPIGLGRATLDITFTTPMLTGTAPTVNFHDQRRGTQATVDAGFTPNTMGKDSLGRMWFAYNGGARMFDGANWVTYTAATSGIGSDYHNTVFGASNGDVWFAHNNPMMELAQLSRLQGATWITYTGTMIGSMDVMALGEDAAGTLWVGSMSSGALSFDGVTWRRYTSANSGLANNAVRQIARDGQGRMWFLNGWGGIGTPGGLSVFDGVNWKTYGEADGLPSPMYLGPLFGDSQGRIWVGAYNAVNPNASKSVGLFDGSAWTFYGIDEMGGGPACKYVSGFAEDPQGRVWMATCDGMTIYANGQWSRRTDLANLGNAFLFDSHGNLWFSYSGLRVQWGGDDYPVVDNAQWLSSTHYRASYDFSPLVRRGHYALAVSGALAQDGLALAPDSSKTFLVDYAGFVSDGTPPSQPLVAAGNDGSLTSLSFSWTSSDAQSGIDQYKYAIGTTPGGREVVDWTYVGKTTTTVTRAGLLLTAGQVYYITVAARNTQGLWSPAGVSNAVQAGAAPQYKLYLPAVRR